ncbi:hypothetical protein SLE2022_406090 [Rubroshorea leprosula]
MGPPMVGRLAHVVQGGGKVRIFAIGNWCNQRLLTPIHSWLASLLKMLPTDGTFNQIAPLHRLKGQSRTFCFDLTAATDRWPLLFLFEVFEVLFDRSFSSAVVNSALGTNLFYVDFIPGASVDKQECWVSFIAGQPLGYKSSWPLFSLTHHILVWWCAEQVYPGISFTCYCILGDDIVIADEKVARLYAEVLEDLQVTISMSKSLISSSGAVEFAKRFMVENVSVDLSPVTLKSVLGIHNPLNRFSLIHRRSKIRFSTFRRLGGAGYRACSRLPPHLHSQREKFEWGLWSRLQHPSLEYFFGEGKPLTPTMFWYTARYLVDFFKPKQLKGPPLQIFATEEQATFQEYTMLRSHVSSWLEYNQWWFQYYRLVNNYLDYCDAQVRDKINRLDLEDIFSAPVCELGWKMRRLDHIVLFSRFNLLHKLKCILDDPPAIRELPEGRVSVSTIISINGISFLLGPDSYNTFLVIREGLISPPDRLYECVDQQ